MAQIYKHGAYGEFVESIGEVATQSDTIAVYVGLAPVNLVRGYADAGVVNAPVKISDFSDAKEHMGYSADWAAFTLCEALKVHFDNPVTNAGPIVAINVLDPATHRKEAETTKQLTFSNGQATITSATIILDTLVLADKVEGVDYSVDYNWTTGQVIIDSLTEEKITGTVAATYAEVDTSKITKADIIGGVTSGGVYSGLGCVGLIYPEVGVIPNLILAPGWSHEPDVYQAMIAAGKKINGHWDAYVLADIPLVDKGSKIDTIDAAYKWADENGYTSERSDACWPMHELTTGGYVHDSTMRAWKQLIVDASHNGIPMETASNKAIPIKRNYFGEGSKNRGFDQSQANKLNEHGICTAVYWGGQWVLWGGHTAAYKFGKVLDKRVIFSTSIRMMMYVTNSFQQEWASTIDQPMTVQMADTIRNREQEKADALVAIGALIGSPVVQFRKSENSNSEIAEGNFVWDFEGTPTPQFKSGTIHVAYSDAGLSSYFGEEA